MGDPSRRPLHFIGSSLKDLQRLPDEVQDVFGSALLDAQYGDEPDGSRPFGEGLPKTVRKLAEDLVLARFRTAAAHYEQAYGR
jgi:phage-related protein